MAPAPLAVIYSTHDEFVPPEEARRLMQAAADPKRFWSVPASDHRFSDNLPELTRCLHQAIDWVRTNQAK